MAILNGFTSVIETSNSLVTMNSAVQKEADLAVGFNITVGMVTMKTMAQPLTSNRLKCTR